MGITTSLDESERIIGVDEAGKYVRLKDILDRHKDLENMLKYTREFVNHHMESRGRISDYQTEIFYARNVISLVKAYAPTEDPVPVFEEKPPDFDGTVHQIKEHEFRIYITWCLDYCATTLASIKIT